MALSAKRLCRPNATYAPLPLPKLSLERRNLPYPTSVQPAPKPVQKPNATPNIEPTTFQFETCSPPRASLIMNRVLRSEEAGFQKQKDALLRQKWMDRCRELTKCFEDLSPVLASVAGTSASHLLERKILVHLKCFPYQPPYWFCCATLTTSHVIGRNVCCVIV